MTCENVRLKLQCININAVIGKQSKKGRCYQSMYTNDKCVALKKAALNHTVGRVEHRKLSAKVPDLTITRCVTFQTVNHCMRDNL